jgi:hypothetical protein
MIGDFTIKTAKQQSAYSTTNGFLASFARVEPQRAQNDKTLHLYAFVLAVLRSLRGLCLCR